MEDSISPMLLMADMLLRLVVIEGLKAGIWSFVVAVTYLLIRRLES